ncbi:ABSCISIC ACID-INSENSITIVE 5-like protein 2 [Quillaja saponaria]|uniref:ABSCISIC ACID-INSENSITIVE 5-like protein 2 n=1 Tax=Quillaja saponaria TaxID=32244 RepID=A0AAD7PZF4_QUISA|nr:ABSCISIC ACID-INSENSITIVE 5-like protein 2 [Quillaja saponaria]
MRSKTSLGIWGNHWACMNLDELLKSVWTAEANQPNGLGSDCTANGQPGQLASASPLHRQGSLTLSRDLSKKTVDEVWRDIHKKNNEQEKKAQERQPTLGEMTLEDFLMKAGVVTESFPTENIYVSGVDSNVVQERDIPQHAHWMQYQLPSVMQPQHHHPHQRNMITSFLPGHTIQQPFPVGVNPILDAAYPETAMTMSPSSLLGTLSDTQTPGRKRVASGDVVEKTVERRQKRMIKNRESAARSRARRQAYTQELEIKVSRLEEENERLRRQREVEKELPCAPPPEPKHQLRRTSSASF